ncbi:MAG: hypothetical protein MI922_26740, partial [Bacteroidales bacterium]|nr:hypothetical protein [Bacteroidales bacterium]
YAIESGYLKLEEPLLKRPESKWKPKPVTESYLRTKNWEYYIPYSQKNALKEYKYRIKNNELGDLVNLPSEYINLFNNTGQKEYEMLKMEGKKDLVARIDLVKVMMGANYLGVPQITYISNAVLNAVKHYSTSKLPTVIIFDEFEAAAAMTLSAEGYNIESIVFKSSANLSEEEMQQRTEQIGNIIDDINDYNSKAFQKRLGSYYNQ